MCSPRWWSCSRCVCRPLMLNPSVALGRALWLVVVVANWLRFQASTLVRSDMCTFYRPASRRVPLRDHSNASTVSEL